MVAKVSNMSGKNVKHEWRKCFLSVKGVGCSGSMWRYVCIYYIMYARIVVDKKKWRTRGTIRMYAYAYKKLRVK